jgi:hypothetical protein
MNYSTSRVLRWRTHVELDSILFAIPNDFYESRMEIYLRADQCGSSRPPSTPSTAAMTARATDK